MRNRRERCIGLALSNRPALASGFQRTRLNTLQGLAGVATNSSRVRTTPHSRNRHRGDRRSPKHRKSSTTSSANAAACQEARQIAGPMVSSSVIMSVSPWDSSSERATDGVAQSGPRSSDASATKCASSAATSPPNAFSRNERPS